MDIHVPDVGDGLSCSILTVGDDRIQIDCGSQQSPAEAFYKGMMQAHPDYFFLSHFHSDHYNGLFEGLRTGPVFRIL